MEKRRRQSVKEARHFFVLGAMKAGTTSLADYLAQHPDILLSEPKETLFFETGEYEKGLEHYLGKYYRGWSGESVIGEASPDNLYLSYVPGRIRESFPEALLVCILRNPADRAYSHWRMFSLAGLEDLSFGDAVSREMETMNSGSTLEFEGEEGARLWNERMGVSKKTARTMSKNYVDSGYYARQIKRYLARFPESRMKTVLFEDLVSDPASLVSGLWEFLGVDPTFRLRDDAPRNPTYRSKRVYSVVKRISTVTGLNELVPAGVKVRLSGALADIGKVEKMDSRVRSMLVEHYRGHNRELSEILGRELPGWDK